MLCACQNEHSLWLKLILLALAATLALAGLTAGRDQDRGMVESNRSLVQRDLARGAVVLALGTEMDVMEHRGLIESLKTPGCAGADDPVPEELLALRGALKAELARHMPSEVGRVLKTLTPEKLLDALTKAAGTEGTAAFDMEEFRVEVGFATYHWHVRVRPAEEKGAGPPQDDRMVVLPCTKQAYVKLSLRLPPRVRL